MPPRGRKRKGSRTANKSVHPRAPSFLARTSLLSSSQAVKKPTPRMNIRVEDWLGVKRCIKSRPGSQSSFKQRNASKTLAIWLDRLYLSHNVFAQPGVAPPRVLQVMGTLRNSKKVIESVMTIVPIVSLEDDALVCTESQQRLFQFDLNFFRVQNYRQWPKSEAWVLELQFQRIDESSAAGEASSFKSLACQFDLLGRRSQFLNDFRLDTTLQVGGITVGTLRTRLAWQYSFSRPSDEKDQPKTPLSVDVNAISPALVYQSRSRPDATPSAVEPGAVGDRSNPNPVKTEERNRASCPWCGFQALDFCSLMCHFECSHSDMGIEYRIKGEPPQAFVRPTLPKDGAPAVDGSPPNVRQPLEWMWNLKAEDSRLSVRHAIMLSCADKGTKAWAASSKYLGFGDLAGKPDYRRKRHSRTLVAGSPSTDRKKKRRRRQSRPESDAIEDWDPRFKLGRQFYHSSDLTPCDERDLDYDSDTRENVDNRWVNERRKQRIEQRDDLTHGEILFMNRWNDFVDKKDMLADCVFPKRCEEFAREHGRWLLENDIRQIFLLHLLTMWEWDLVSSRAIHKCMLIVDLRGDPRKASIDVNEYVQSTSMLSAADREGTSGGSPSSVEIPDQGPGAAGAAVSTRRSARAGTRSAAAGKRSARGSSTVLKS